MKKLILVLGVTLGLGFAGVQAQDRNPRYQDQDSASASVKGKKSETTGDMQSTEPKSPEENRADKADKSKAGNTLDKSGQKVEKGASKTWDKTKHNKATKNVFNQPGDE